MITNNQNSCRTSLIRAIHQTRTEVARARLYIGVSGSGVIISHAPGSSYSQPIFDSPNIPLLSSHHKQLHYTLEKDVHVQYNYSLCGCVCVWWCGGCYVKVK